MSRAPLSGLVAPRGIVVFGASPDPKTLGGALTRNLLESEYQGAVSLVNPRHKEIQGRPCHRSLDDAPGDFDLALIMTPGQTVKEIVEQCGKRHIRFAIVHSSGFAEAGEIGACVETDLLAAARRCGVRILGPRALGFIRPSVGLNATPFFRRLPAGDLAFVAQSGSVCTSVMDWAFNNEFALSNVFAPGHGGDIDLPEIIDFLAGDPATASILLYLEGVRASRPFLSAVRAAARNKPVVVVKAGGTAGTAKLARQHIQAAAGNDDAFDAALRRAGALRVQTIGDLFTAARALSSTRRPSGNRLAIIANGGGPTIVAADAAARMDMPLAALSPATKAHLAMRLPLSWSTANPIDLLMDADGVRYEIALTAALADPGVDSVLVIITPSGLTEPAEIVTSISSALAASSKPVLVTLLGESSVAEARRTLTRQRIPTFRTAESAIAALAFMIDFRRNQTLLLETPPSTAARRAPSVAEARVIIDFALGAGRRTLTDGEARQVASAFHIAIATEDAKDRGVGSLRIQLGIDAVWGPVLRIVEGSPLGHPVTGYALPPLNERLGSDLLATPAIATLVKGSAATRRLRDMLMAVSDMACELPWIDALELCIDLSEGLPASGIRLAIRPWSGKSWHYSHMVICPYPQGLESEIQGRDGRRLQLRPIRPEDASAFQDFVRALGEKSRYYRFFGSLRELSPSALAGCTQIDYDREMTLVATDAAGLLVGEARYTVLSNGHTCEFGIVVADALAGQGIGAHLMQGLMEAARQRGLRTMVGEVLADNAPMLRLMANLGFSSTASADPEVMAVSRKLR